MVHEKKSSFLCLCQLHLRSDLSKKVEVFLSPQFDVNSAFPQASRSPPFSVTTKRLWPPGAALHGQNADSLFPCKPFLGQTCLCPPCAVSLLGICSLRRGRMGKGDLFFLFFVSEWFGSSLTNSPLLRALFSYRGPCFPLKKKETPSVFCLQRMGF